MILSLSWKNIWRSKRRSFVVIGAIILGVWSLIFMIAFYNSFGEAFIRNAVYYQYSHLQIKNPAYVADPKLDHFIKDEKRIIEFLNQSPNIEAWSVRSIVNAMLSSPKNSVGIQVFGVDPMLEAKTTSLDSQLVEGTYFEKISRNPILISK
jgi:ABC-type lipoprotein release transport system permease subunit